MIPGEYLLQDQDIELNAGRATAAIEVTNRGDRPVQVGSHCHFFEVNRALDFDRALAYGMLQDALSRGKEVSGAVDSLDSDLMLVRLMARPGSSFHDARTLVRNVLCA